MHDVLLIAGCSHAAGAEINGSQDSVYNRQHSFGNCLARILNKIPVNIGHHGISNQGIARLVMSWVNNQWKREDVNLSVLISWTDSGRMELSRPYEIDGLKIVRSADWFDNTQSFVYNVNHGTGEGDGGEYTKDEILYFEEVKRFMVSNPSYMELSSIHTVLMLQNFLKLNNINYLMCNSTVVFADNNNLLTDYYVPLVDQNRYYEMLDPDKSFYMKYKNLGYENPKARYWHHDEIPHKMWADELAIFAGEKQCF